MDTASVVRSTAIFYTSEHLLSCALSRGSLRLTDDNVRGPLIRPNTHRISYDPLSRPIHYPDTNSDDHSFALSLRSCAPRYVLCTVIRAQRARTPFVLVINTCALQAARCKFLRGGTSFLRGAPPAGKFRIRVSPPAARDDPSRVFVTRGTRPQLFIAFTPMIRRLSLVRTRRCCCTHPRQFDIHY